MENGWKSIHYSDYWPVEPWCRQDCHPFIGSSKRLPVSVAVQIILPAWCRGVGFKHKPAKLNNHTTLCRKRIFPSGKRGSDEKKDWNQQKLFISLAPFLPTGKGLPHWNELTEDADCLYHWGRHQFVFCDIHVISTATASIPHSLV